MALLISLLLFIHIHICNSFDTFNQYTFFYESHHYDFESHKNENDNSISIVDAYNNTIMFNSSLIITINNEPLEYMNDNDWKEIHHYVHPNPHQLSLHTNSQNRRRLWNWLKKSFRGLRRFLKRLFGILAIPPPKHYRFWEKRWLRKGRFIGFYPGYFHQKGLPYRTAEKYCNENFGGLATILSTTENRQVLGLCQQLMAKFKPFRECKRKCRYYLFKGTKCWQSCGVPKVHKLYAKKHWKGHNCWIGLKLGESTKKEKAFKTWNDKRPVLYKNWSPGEPNCATKRHCKRVWGTDEKTCEVENIWYEKCTEMYVYKAGHVKVKRSPQESKLFLGVPTDIQQAISPKGNGIFKIIHRVGKWNNARCSQSRVPVCQKPRGQVYGRFIAVRAARSYAIASAYCADWYGTELATIDSDEDNVAAMEACRMIDSQKTSCWIGLQRPFKEWDDTTEAEKFTNWAPGEPNNAGYSENCVEMYSRHGGRWNDLNCAAKRFFLCNAQNFLQRMDTNLRKKMIIKRLRRHRDRWKRYRRAEYRKKIRRAYREKMIRFMQQQRKMQRQAMERRRSFLRQRVFQQAYGGFMQRGRFPNYRAMDHMGGLGGTTAIFGGMKRMNTGFRRRMAEGESDEHEYEEAEDEYGSAEDDDYVDRKCTFFNGLHGSGFFEMCIDENGIDIRRYMKKEKVFYANDVWNGSLVFNDSYLNYMEYEDLKHKLAMKYDDGMIYALDNEKMNEEIVSYHLSLKQIVYDLYADESKQCEQYFNHFELCMEWNVDNLLIEIIKSRKIVFPSTLLSFYGNNTQWNEIINEQRESIQIVSKCIHIFEAKICIECQYDADQTNSENRSPFSIVANILMNDHLSLYAK